MTTTNDSIETEVHKKSQINGVQEELLQIQLRKERLALEQQELATQFAKAQLEDLREQMDQRALKRDNLSSRSRENGKTIEQNKLVKVRTQNACNHRKGGNGLAAYLGGKGNDPNYAIIRHTMCNGDTWVRCQRCAKTWKPPVESTYEDKAEYYKAVAGYAAAMEWPTTNQPSGSAMFKFSDNGENYRLRNAHVEL